jgi:hypothetical protein
MRRLASIAAFFALAVTLLAPFRVADQVAGSKLKNPVPAGEFVDGTRILQTGEIPVSDAIAKRGRHVCFGIQFATYARTNRGNLRITWQQGEHVDKWVMRSAHIKDNEFKYFCPSGGIAAGRQFEIAVEGAGTKAGHAPTAWLTGDTRFGDTTINGVEQKASLSLRFASFREITTRHIIHFDRGAYFFGWLTSVLIGLAAIMAMGPIAKRRPFA